MLGSDECKVDGKAVSGNGTVVERWICKCCDENARHLYGMLELKAS
jgi:hypothetical protein